MRSVSAGLFSAIRRSLFYRNVPACYIRRPHTDLLVALKPLTSPEDDDRRLLGVDAQRPSLKARLWAVLGTVHLSATRRNPEQTLSRFEQKLRAGEVEMLDRWRSGR